jgi:uncharacterized peroxidase-related enzyme
VHAHAADFRGEVEGTAEERAARALALQSDWRSAGLEPADAALCGFAEKLTLTPAAMSAADVEALRRAGFGDRAIHDAIQVVSYFNYINRVADGVHVDLEPGMPPYPARAAAAKRTRAPGPQGQALPP